jgi:hypothetical protein
MKGFKALAVAASIAAAFAVGTAHGAATVTSVFQPGLNQLSDNSAESLINVSGAANIVDVNDRLRGIFGLDTIEPITAGGATRFYNGVDVRQFAGIFDITVVAKIDSGVVGSASRYTFVFAPTAIATSGFGAAFAAPAGTAVIFFEKNADGLTFSRINPACTTTGAGGDCEGTVTSGATPYWYAGFSEGNEFWVATSATDNIATIGAGGSTTIGGGFNIGLNQLPGGSGVDIGTLPAAECLNSVAGLDMCGSGSLLGKGSAVSPYSSFDDVNFVVNIEVVPEPGSLALLGLGLGLGALVLRRRRVA